MKRGPARLPRLPFGPLERLHDATYGRNVCAMARRLGQDRGAIHRARREGVTEPMADRLAVALGYHPVEVWGDDWWELAQ